MVTQFKHLNDGWNSNPNAPMPEVEVGSGAIDLHFVLNPFAYPGVEAGEKGIPRFHGCTLYRLGPTNDEGWYRGQCRFSKLAPKWGEFYEVTGDLLLDRCPDDWVILNVENAAHHFLFYFRDDTFECNAARFEFLRPVRAA